MALAMSELSLVTLATSDDRAAASNTIALPPDVPFNVIGEEPMPKPPQLPKTPTGDKLFLTCKLCSNIYHVAMGNACAQCQLNNMTELKFDFLEFSWKATQGLALTQKEADTMKGIVYLLDERISDMTIKQRVYKDVTDEMAKKTAMTLPCNAKADMYMYTDHARIPSTADAGDEPFTAGAHCFRQLKMWGCNYEITIFGTSNKFNI